MVALSRLADNDNPQCKQREQWKYKQVELREHEVHYIILPQCLDWRLQVPLETSKHYPK